MLLLFEEKTKFVWKILRAYSTISGM